jgi:hypothetical protein
MYHSCRTSLSLSAVARRQGNRKLYSIHTHTHTHTHTDPSCRTATVALNAMQRWRWAILPWIPPDVPASMRRVIPCSSSLALPLATTRRFVCKRDLYSVKRDLIIIPLRCSSSLALPLATTRRFVCVCVCVCVSASREYTCKYTRKYTHTHAYTHTHTHRQGATRQWPWGIWFSMIPVAKHSLPRV